MLKTLIIAAAALALTACASPIGGNSSAAMADLFKEILTSPNCGHDDKIAVVTGAAGIPGSVTASAERHCPMPAAPAAP